MFHLVFTENIPVPVLRFMSVMGSVIRYILVT